MCSGSIKSLDSLSSMCRDLVVGVRRVREPARLPYKAHQPETTVVIGQTKCRSAKPCGRIFIMSLHYVPKEL